MSTVYKSIINHLREGNINQRELNSLEDGLERLFKRIEDLENESYKNNEQKEEMRTHIDCLKAELAEVQMNKQEVDVKLKAEKTKNHYLNHVVENLNDISRRLRDESEKLQANEIQKQELPEEPIKVAGILIDKYIERTREFDRSFSEENTGMIVLGSPTEEFRQKQVSDLRQIAEHLLVYCNRAEVE